MVGEIVVHRHAADFAADLHAPLHVLEAGQRIQPMGQRNADMAGGKQGGAGIGAVVFAGKSPDGATDSSLGPVSASSPRASSPVT
jgi:hypothetical protein